MNAQAQFVLALLSTDLTGGQRPHLAVPICEELFGTVAIEAEEGIDFLLQDQQIVPYAKDWEELLQQGYETLAAKQWEDHQVVQPGAGVGDIHVLHLSWWGASKLFQIEDVVADLGLPCRHGMLFSVPDIHTLQLHELTGPSAIPTAAHMVAYATYGYDQAEHGLSPDLFFFRDGTVQKVSVPGPDGRPTASDVVGLFAESYTECLRAPAKRLDAVAGDDGEQGAGQGGTQAISWSDFAARPNSADQPDSDVHPVARAGVGDDLGGIRTVILADLRGRGLVVTETADPAVVLIDGRRLDFADAARTFSRYPAEQWAIVVSSWADAQVPLVLPQR